MPIDLLILWFVFVLFGSILGHYCRGRLILGFTLSFLFGPLGWIMLWALNDHRRYCPHCRSLVDLQATVCHRCTRSLTVRSANP